MGRLSTTECTYLPTYLGHSPFPHRPCLGQVVRAHCPFCVGAPGVGMGTLHPPNSASSCVLALRDLGPAQGRPGGGGGGCDSMRAFRGPALSLPQLPVLGAGGRGQLPMCSGPGLSGRGDPSPTTRRTFFRVGFSRCGACTRAPGGAVALCASVRGVWGRALSLPQPPVLQACGRAGAGGR